MCAGNLSERKIAYSIGIGSNVVWDKDMVRRGYEVFQYDHTIKRPPELDMCFHWNRIGIGAHDNNNIKTLRSMLESNGHSDCDGMILKIDVEGAEWESLAVTDVETLRRFDQIIIEFHDLLVFPRNPEMIQSLKILMETHYLVHLHGCNFNVVDIYDSIITPNVVEATFVLKDKYQVSDEKQFLPNEYDVPDWAEVPEIILGTWNV